MSNNKPKKEITETMKKDYVTNKLLLVFTIAFAMLLFFVNIGRMMTSPDFIRTFNLARKIANNSVWVGLGLFAVGIVIFVIERIVKADTRYRLFSGKHIAIVSAIFTLAALLLRIRFWPDTLSLIYILICSLVVLYIVRHSYQSEFFMVVLSSILSGVTIWLVKSEFIFSISNIVLIAVAAIIVLLAAFTVVTHIRGGNLNLFKREISLFKPTAKYAFAYIAYILSALLLVATIFFPGYALYFIFTLIGYILLSGIYFTVKLI